MPIHRPPAPRAQARSLAHAARASIAALLACVLAVAPLTASLAQAAESDAADEVVGNLAIVAYTEDRSITDGHSFVVFTSYVDGLELNFTDLYGYYEMTDEYKAACKEDESLLTWRSQFEEAKAEVGSDITMEEYEQTGQFERGSVYPELYQAVYDLGDENFKSVEGEVKDGDERYRQVSYDCALDAGDYISIGLYNLSSSSAKKTLYDAIANSTLKDELGDIIEKNATGGKTKEEIFEILAGYLEQYLNHELSSADLLAMVLSYLRRVLTNSGFEAAELLIDSYKNRVNLIDGDTKGGIYVNREIWRQKVYQTLAPNQIYSIDITRSQLERMMDFYNSGSESHYSIFTHNCVSVCTGAWNAAVGTDADGNKTELNLSGLDDSYKYLDGFYSTVRKLRDNIIVLGEQDAGGTCYQADVIRGAEVPDPDPDDNYTGWNADGTRWYDNGVVATEHAFFDPESDAWYWADADGTIARDKDVYIPKDETKKNADGTWGDGKWVRFDEDRKMVKGEDFRYGSWYHFDEVTGEMAHGDVYLRSSGGKWVRYDAVTGRMVYGLDYRYGAWYYFDPVTGAMAHGGVYVPAWGAYHYFDAVTGRG